VKLDHEIIIATDELRYSMRKAEERKDPWIPDQLSPQFSEYAVALIELMGNEAANEAMTEAVITELGKKEFVRLRAVWISVEASWIDICLGALRQAGKEVP